MTDILLQWIANYRSELEQSGFKLEWKGGYSGSSSIKIDNLAVVGSIVFWPENRFEFEFLSRKDGNKILFAEREVSTVDELNEFFTSLRPKMGGQSDVTDVTPIHRAATCVMVMTPKAG